MFVKSQVIFVIFWIMLAVFQFFPKVSNNNFKTINDSKCFLARPLQVSCLKYLGLPNAQTSSFVLHVKLYCHLSFHSITFSVVYIKYFILALPKLLFTVCLVLFLNSGGFSFFFFFSWGLFLFLFLFSDSEVVNHWLLLSVTCILNLLPSKSNLPFFSFFQNCLLSFWSFWSELFIAICTPIKIWDNTVSSKILLIFTHIYIIVKLFRPQSKK